MGITALFVALMRQRPLLWSAALCLCAVASAHAQTISYHVSVPSPEQGWMRVELQLDEMPPVPLELNLSRYSPGRYAEHAFARHVSNVEARDASGATLALEHPSNSTWVIRRHGPAVRIQYTVTHTQLDGTYVAIDATHAHINMPAALMWVRGLDRTPVSVRVTLPQGQAWRVATQLFPGDEPLAFTAPNLQYLMDSPIEMSAFESRSFQVGDGGNVSVTLVVHHGGTNQELDGLASDVRRIVRAAADVFGEWPAFDTGRYTFLADYMPSATPDGMEHRNSAVLTVPGSIRSHRDDLLDGFAHEFFHAWNVERIRPRSLEPFAFNRPNRSGELWLAEGFTEYYGPLSLTRAGLHDISWLAVRLGALVADVEGSAARRSRSLEAMSRMATDIDGAEPARVAAAGPFVSYYSWGAVVALALDLELRARTNGQASLDDVMRQLWTRFGRLDAPAAGIVARPYVFEDVRRAIADVSGDPGFARRFLARYVRGSDVPDLRPLLMRVGLAWRTVGGRTVLRPIELDGAALSASQRDARRAWLGPAGTDARAGQEKRTPRASFDVGSRARLMARISSRPASP